jgi:type VI secretion system secreted protein Hcp
MRRFIPRQACMAIFMSIDGITGEHVVNDSEGWILLDSISWSMVRNSSAVRPSLRARIEPSVSEITCTKQTDGSTIALLTEALRGKFDRSITIDFMRQGVGRQLAFLSYTLTDAGITAFSQSGADGVPIESFALNFMAIQVKHTLYSDDFTGVPSSVMYNLPDGQ